MEKSPTDIRTHRFESFDGVGIAWHETGEGRPLLLIHGLFSDAQTNWIKYGHAARIAAAGFRVIMPDLRAHGASNRPHEKAAYPADVLARDQFALIAHLGLQDFDLAGYSLGGRTAVRMLVEGARPRKVVISGMGLQGLLDTEARAAHFRKVLDGIGTHQRGTPEWMAEAFLKTTGGDPVALRLLIDTFVDTSEAELKALNLPALIVSGAEDADNGSSEALAELLPDGRFVSIPGNHMSAVTRRELGEAIAEFLTE